MTFKEQLEKLGYNLSFSEKCPVIAWGKWHVLFKREKGTQVAGYGDDENSAFEDAIKTARKIEEILK